MNLGKKIKYARKLRGLTQKDLARKLDYTEGHISHIESGRRRISVDDLLKLQHYLEINLVNK